MRFRAFFLARLRRDSDHALKNRDEISEDLRNLAYLAKYVKPRARSVCYFGIRFPVRQGFAINSVLDPETGRPLVGTVAL